MKPASPAGWPWLRAASAADGSMGLPTLCCPASRWTRSSRASEGAAGLVSAAPLQRAGAANVAGVSVLVDSAVWPLRGDHWAHLVSDTSYDELHEFAAARGIPRRGFQGDHYDVPSALRESAIQRGAEPVSSRELVRRLRAAGLRRQRD